MRRRLDQMSLFELEQAGQWFYEQKGRRAGKQADGDDEPDAEWVDDPPDTLQPWEVEPAEDDDA